MKCPNLEGCPLFPLFRMKTSLSVWQIRYCESAFETCARYVRSKSGARVPPNLLPNGSELNLDPTGTTKR